MASFSGTNRVGTSNTVWVFKTSGTFIPQFSGTVEVLVVAGGGGGGMDMGGGGGGGGVISNSSFTVTSGTTYVATVGAGGYGAPAGGGTYRTDGAGPQPGGHQFTISATNGGNSVFGSLTAIGGGYGGSSYYGYLPNYGIGGAGGSGGGNSGYTAGATTIGPSGTAGQGNKGGNGGGGSYYSGGGGGAGGAGADGPNRANGGVGVYNSILGTGYYWAGGGGGSNYSLGDGSNGGLGGGGGGTAYSGIAGLGGTGYNNGSNSAVPAANGTSGGNAGANTGGGGGGGSHYNVTNKGGEGGSGIVIVRFLTSQGIATVTNGTVISNSNLVLSLDANNIKSSGPTTVEALVVAGGGGGGFEMGGGGGGGGVVYNSAYNMFRDRTYYIAVGQGGSGRTSNGDNTSNAGNSSIGGSGIVSITAIAGGAGGNNTNTYDGTATSGRPTNGGSGGGTGEGQSVAPGTPGQGYAGGAAIESGYYHSGGGGGAGGAGSAGATDGGGNGGIGLATSISGTLTTVSTLVVGGGGGGGMDMGGGGGGGGVLYNPSISVIPGTAYTVTVGAGGYGAPAGGGTYRTDGAGPQPGGHQFTISATNGGTSSIFGITAIGGGFGASSYYGYLPNSGIGGTGASGGGCSGYTHGGSRIVDNGTPGQGFSGGNSGNPASGDNSHYSGGGGGASQRGASGPNRPTGGNGRQYPQISPFYFGGGGGGATHPPSSGLGGHGGAGGGGGGSSYEGPGGFGDTTGINPAIDGIAGANQPGGNAGASTGGGGGGGSHYNSNNKGGEGGSGIVIIRYPGVARATGGTITSVNGDTVHTFTTSGTFTVGTQTYYGGGGAGGTYSPSSPTRQGIGGLGGGGGAFFSADGAAGLANTGGGGGGGSYSPSKSGGAGGSGVVIIRYRGAPQATGGIITTSGNDTIHTFTASDYFTFGNNPGVEVLVVGGGGGGGGSHGAAGGGGGGGLVYHPNKYVQNGVGISVTVGAGGQGGRYYGGSTTGNYGTTNNSHGFQGGSSSFSDIIAQGGGGGNESFYTDSVYKNGGSGGGAGDYYFGVSNPGASRGGLATQTNSGGGTGYGFPGGSRGPGGPTIAEDFNHSAPHEGSGGGGAGGTATGGGPSTASNGGIGRYYPQFASVGGSPPGWFAGGGGGGVYTNGPFTVTNSIGSATGYFGGGGRGADGTGSANGTTAGVANTGGGGGGGSGNNSLPHAKDGGSGVVIVRYPGVQRATGGIVTTISYSVGTETRTLSTVHTFLSGGTFTPNSNFNDGPQWTDISGNNNHGILTNGANNTTENIKSIVFDGVNDKITFTHKVDAGARSFFVWVKFNSLSHSSGYQLMGTQESNAYTYIGIENGGGIYYYAGAATGGNIGNAVTVNTWVNLGLVLNSDGSRVIYKNGVAVHSNTGGIGVAATLPFTIGTLNDNYWLNGSVAHTSLYSRALTAAEVQQNFNAVKERFLGYQTITYSFSANMSLSNNGTDTVTFTKNADNNSWNGQAYSTQAFSAPCTIEFSKRAAAGGGDNGASYAMIGWNTDPTADANYSSIDHSAYPYTMNNYHTYNNGAGIAHGTTWDENQKFYIVYDTDGFIRHYNGSKLLYQASYGTNNTVYVDCSLYNTDPTFGIFKDVRVSCRSWNGLGYV
jgi:hypothetical protein